MDFAKRQWKKIKNLSPTGHTAYQILEIFVVHLEIKKDKYP